MTASATLENYTTLTDVTREVLRIPVGNQDPQARVDQT